jgi:hypothetical protein
MLTLLEMKTQVGRLIQKTDATYATKIVDFLNQRYDDILRRFAWPQLFRETTVMAATDDPFLIIGKDVELIIQLHDRVNDIVLTPTDPLTAARAHVGLLDVSGIPHTYYRIEDTIAKQPTAASALSISSDDVDDTQQTVRIWGISGGQEVTESKLLTGTTAVTSGYSYTRVDRVSKSAVTEGTVTLTANAGAVTVATLAPRELTARYLKIRLIRRPSSAIVYDLTYRLKAPRLEFDEDIPLIPCHNALIIGGYAQALEEQRQFAKAGLEWQKYNGQIDWLIAQLMQQSDHLVHFTPHIEHDSLDVPK